VNDVFCIRAMRVYICLCVYVSQAAGVAMVLSSGRAGLC